MVIMASSTEMCLSMQPAFASPCSGSQARPGLTASTEHIGSSPPSTSSGSGEGASLSCP